MANLYDTLIYLYERVMILLDCNMRLLDLPLELLIHILSALTLTDMRVLMLVNAGWRHLIQRFLSRKLNVGLRPFVEDPDLLRHILRTSHSVISGSFAIDFGFHGTTCPSIEVDDLDIYCGVANAITVIDHLCHNEGYLALPMTPLPCTHWIGDRDSGIASVVRMLHPRGTKVDVICSTRISALHPIAYSWSTLAMSFLTADGFCSAYYSLALKGIGCLNPSRQNTIPLKSRVKKYKRMGFRIVDFDDREVYSHPTYSSALPEAVLPSPQNALTVWDCPHVPRRFSDVGSFRMHFEIPSATTEEHDLFPFEEPEWTMGGAECGGACRRRSRSLVKPIAAYS